MNVFEFCLSLEEKLTRGYPTTVFLYLHCVVRESSPALSVWGRRLHNDGSKCSPSHFQDLFLQQTSNCADDDMWNRNDFQTSPVLIFDLLLLSS